MAVGLYNIIARACNIPPVPVVAARVMRAVIDPETSAEELSRIISADSMLVARILKVANSAFYGLSRSIPNLQMAVTIMGFKTIKNMVIALSTKSMYSLANPTEKFIWEHSLSTALADKYLASNVGLGNSDDVFISGLLHDIGKVLLIDQNPDSYARVLPDYIKSGESTIGFEREIFGFTHAEVGAALCRKWKLPEDLEGSVKFHHSKALDRLNELEPYMGKLSAIAALANSISNKLHYGAKISFQQFRDSVTPACDVLSISNDELKDYTTKIRELFQQEKEMFSI